MLHHGVATSAAHRARFLSRLQVFGRNAQFAAIGPTGRRVAQPSRSADVRNQGHTALHGPASEGALRVGKNWKLLTRT